MEDVDRLSLQLLSLMGEVEMNSKPRGCWKDGAPPWGLQRQWERVSRPAGSSNLLSPCLTATPLSDKGAQGSGLQADGGTQS